MLDELKPWLCRNGEDRDHAHVLGWVRNGALVLLRQAIDTSSKELVEVDVMAIVEGGPVMEIKCSICGAVRSWYVDRRHLKKFVRK